MNHKNKKIFQKRHILVLFVLIVALMTGRDYTIQTAQTQNPDTQSLQNTQLLSSQLSLTKNNVLQTEPGGYYRLLYDVQSSELLDKSSDQTVTLSVYLVSDFDNKQLIDTITLKNGQKTYNRETVFASKESSSGLYFEKSSFDFSSDIAIVNIRSNHLNIRTDAEAANLHKLIVGQTTDEVTQEDKTPVADRYILRGKKENVGRVFEAKSDYISGVDLKLNFIGDGGYGDYLVELREIEEGSVPKISGVLGLYYFTKGSAEANLKVSSSTYHFPLAATLTKGKRYFLSLNNERVKTNYFNTIEILGSGRNGAAGDRSLVFGGGQYQKEIGNLYFKIFNPISNYVNNERIPRGEIIQDIGSGESIYDYRQTGQPSDALDIFSIENGDKYSVHYDNNYNGIITETANNVAFIYKFDGLSPIKNAKISLNGIQQGAVNCLVSYSLDDKNWEDIPVKKFNFDETGTFVKMLGVNEKVSAIYLKITYDPQDLKFRTSRIFGIQNLDVHMILKNR